MPLLIFWTLFLIQFQSQAQSSIELTCRSQAKEIAVQTYQNCVTEARSQKVDEIRKEYQAKLTDLKSFYDQELKNVSGTKAQVQTNANEATSQAQIKLKKSKASRVQVPLTTTKQKRGDLTTKLPEKKMAAKSLPAAEAQDNNQAVVTREYPATEVSDDTPSDYSAPGEE